eukprot:2934863-Rhodomonas_salina.2
MLSAPTPCILVLSACIDWPFLPWLPPINLDIKSTSDSNMSVSDPIPSGPRNPEGLAEATIGKWINQEKGRREKVVIATKITGNIPLFILRLCHERSGTDVGSALPGGGRITGKNIISACEGSLKRLGTDYIDLYQFHWPARCIDWHNLKPVIEGWR